MNSSNSILLRKALDFLKQKKAGKKTIKDFTRFLAEYEDLRKSFHLTFPETPDKIGEWKQRTKS